MVVSQLPGFLTVLSTRCDVTHAHQCSNRCVNVVTGSLSATGGAMLPSFGGEHCLSVTAEGACVACTTRELMWLRKRRSEVPLVVNQVALWDRFDLLLNTVCLCFWQ